MSRVKKKFAALAVLLSLEFLSVGLCTNGFSWANRSIPPLLQVPPYIDAGLVKLDSPAKTDGSFGLESQAEPTPRSGVFLTAEENPGNSVQSFLVSPSFFRIILAPKVPRYISKSVLNL